MRDVLLRGCDSTYVGPTILQYGNGGIGNDGKILKKSKQAKPGEVHIYIYILGSSARIARAEAHGIMLRYNITELCYGIMSRHNFT